MGRCPVGDWGFGFNDFIFRIPDDEIDKLLTDFEREGIAYHLFCLLVTGVIIIPAA